jgi:hypothetical protein
MAQGAPIDLHEISIISRHQPSGLRRSRVSG